ncbi:OsmC family protein [Calidifontibacter terrae]
MTHRYATTLQWTGSTGAGYEAYDRTHQVAASGAPALSLTADPTFGGDPALLNPEQLLLAAASSCQLLSFLAVAARARVDVVSYADDASAEMPPEPVPMRITRIVLRPQVTVRAGARATQQRIEHLLEVAHRECFIANSLATQIDLEPVVTVVD